MVEQVIINLTNEQIRELQPLADELYNHWLETDERQMFVGQVITDRGTDFKRVVFGLVPSDQSEEIERVRGFATHPAPV